MTSTSGTTGKSGASNGTPALKKAGKRDVTGLAMPKRSSHKTAAATCACGSSVGECPECGKLYRHGTTSRCTAPSCRAVNAPIDCKGCGRIVSGNKDGVLDYDHNLVPWKTASVKIEKRQKSASQDYVELGLACDNCVMAIANGDYSGMDDEEEARTRAGIDQIGEYLIVGDEAGFSWRPCDVCGAKGGNRHEVGYLTPSKDWQPYTPKEPHQASKKAAQKRPVKFRTLNVGDEFDFSANEYQSFYDRCVKTGPRTYQSLETLTKYRVGTIDTMVNDLGHHDTSADFVTASAKKAWHDTPDGKPEPKTKKPRLTPQQRKALEHYKFCEREEDRLGGSVFANEYNMRKAQERTSAAHAECKRLGLGIEHGL